MNKETLAVPVLRADRSSWQGAFQGGKPLWLLGAEQGSCRAAAGEAAQPGHIPTAKTRAWEFCALGDGHGKWTNLLGRSSSPQPR